MPNDAGFEGSIFGRWTRREFLRNLAVLASSASHLTSIAKLVEAEGGAETAPIALTFAVPERQWLLKLVLRNFTSSRSSYVANGKASIALILPFQHIAEETLAELDGATDQKVYLANGMQLHAMPSALLFKDAKQEAIPRDPETSRYTDRLVFEIVQGTRISTSLEALLLACEHSVLLSVADAGKRNRTAANESSVIPQSNQTALFMPMGCVFSPDEYARFSMANVAAVPGWGGPGPWRPPLGSWTPIGFIRLLAPHPFRVIGWSTEDFAANPHSKPGAVAKPSVSMLPGQRKALGANMGKEAAPPATVTQLLLTPFGATVDAQWSMPTGGLVTAWLHGSAMGRLNQEVLEDLGLVFPTGHRCRRVRTTDRKTWKSEDNVVVSYLRTITYVEVLELTKAYEAHDLDATRISFGGQVDKDLFLPVQPLVTPPLDFDERDSIYIAPSDKSADPNDEKQSSVRYLRVNGKHHEFTAWREDHAGAWHLCRFRAIYSNAPTEDADGKIVYTSTAKDNWDKAAGAFGGDPELRRVDLYGAKVAFARGDEADRTAALARATDYLEVGSGSSGGDGKDGTWEPPSPAMTLARIQIPELLPFAEGAQEQVEADFKGAFGDLRRLYTRLNLPSELDLPIVTLDGPDKEMLANLQNVLKAKKPDILQSLTGGSVYSIPGLWAAAVTYFRDRAKQELRTFEEACQQSPGTTPIRTKLDALLKVAELLGAEPPDLGEVTKVRDYAEAAGYIQRAEERCRREFERVARQVQTLMPTAGFSAESWLSAEWLSAIASAKRPLNTAIQLLPWAAGGISGVGDLVVKLSDLNGKFEEVVKAIQRIPTFKSIPKTAGDLDAAKRAAAGAITELNAAIQVISPELERKKEEAVLAALRAALDGAKKVIDLLDNSIKHCGDIQKWIGYGKRGVDKAKEMLESLGLELPAGCLKTINALIDAGRVPLDSFTAQSAEAFALCFRDRSGAGGPMDFKEWQTAIGVVGDAIAVLASGSLDIRQRAQFHIDAFRYVADLADLTSGDIKDLNGTCSKAIPPGLGDPTPPTICNNAIGNLSSLLQGKIQDAPQAESEADVAVGKLAKLAAGCEGASREFATRCENLIAQLLVMLERRAMALGDEARSKLLSEGGRICDSLRAKAKLLAGTASAVATDALGDPRTWTSVKYFSEWKGPENIGNNLNKCVLEIVEPIGATIKQSIGSGIGVPDFAYKGLSLSKGLLSVARDLVPEQAIKTLAGSNFRPRDLIPDGRLFGVLSLRRILSDRFKGLTEDVPGLKELPDRPGYAYHWGTKALCKNEPYVPRDGAAFAMDAEIGYENGVVKTTSSVSLTNFDLEFLGLVTVGFGEVIASTRADGALSVNVKGLSFRLGGDFDFFQKMMDTVGEVLGFQPIIEIQNSRIFAGFDIAVPNIAFGTFSLTGIRFRASVGLSLRGEAAMVRFEFNDRYRPFTVSVWVLGGGGYLGLTVYVGETPRVDKLELAIEAGATVAVSLAGFLSGMVQAMDGIYVRLSSGRTVIEGYRRYFGSFVILDLVTIEALVYLAISKEGSQIVARGLFKVEIRILFKKWSIERTISTVLSGGGASALIPGEASELFADMGLPAAYDENPPKMQFDLESVRNYRGAYVEVI